MPSSACFAPPERPVDLGSVRWRSVVTGEAGRKSEMTKLNETTAGLLLILLAIAGTGLGSPLESTTRLRWGCTR